MSTALQQTVSEKTLCAVAAELAANLKPAPQILAAHNLTTDQFKAIAATPQFRTIFAEAKRLWHSDTNASERVRAKALMALEQMLLEVVRVVNDPDTAPQAKLEGVKVTARLAGMEKQPDADIGGSRFSVTINLPGQQARTIEAEAINEENV